MLAKTPRARPLCLAGPFLALDFLTDPIVLMMLVVVLVAAGIVVLVMRMQGRKDKERLQALRTHAEAQGWSFVPGRANELEGEFAHLAVLRVGQKRITSQVVRGEHAGKKFCAFSHWSVTRGHAAHGPNQAYLNWAIVVLEGDKPMPTATLRRRRLGDGLVATEVDPAHAATLTVEKAQAAFDAQGPEPDRVSVFVDAPLADRLVEDRPDLVVLKGTSAAVLRFGYLTPEAITSGLRVAEALQARAEAVAGT